VSTTRVLNAYNYWAVMALDIFSVIFWLSVMGSNASYAAALAGIVAWSRYSYGGYGSGSSGDTYTYCVPSEYESCSKSKRALDSFVAKRSAYDGGYSLAMGLIGGSAGVAAVEL
jgi:hypothetical protein